MTVRAHLCGASQILAHVPDLVFSGAKPRREIAQQPALRAQIADALRDSAAAAAYLPNQIFIGAAEPRPLTEADRPWWSVRRPPVREGRCGVLVAQSEFLAALRAVDTEGLLDLRDEVIAYDGGSPQGRLIAALDPRRRRAADLVDPVDIPGQDGPLGRVGWGYRGDEALAPQVVLENLATKASGALALAHLVAATDIDPASVDYVITCSEEAVGDRYQRGGGNMGKAIAEAVGARGASGFGVKNFCAAPVPALVIAASFIEAGVARTVAVVAGGSPPKLGMKFQGHLRAGMPILEDCLGGIAVLVAAHRPGPVIRYDAVGRHSVGAGSANEAIFRELVFEPLERVTLRATDVDLFGTELHNPELTEPQGSGDVPLRNYRMIAAVATQRHHLEPAEVDAFLRSRCVAGFAPTQGHIASAVCLLPQVLAGVAAGRIKRAQLVAKGSLFLGRMTAMSDGMSILIEG